VVDKTEEKPEKKPDDAASYENLENLADGEYIPKGEGSKAGRDQADVGGAEMSALLMMLFGLMGAIRGPHWALVQGEADNLGMALDDCIRHYFPDFELGPAGALVLVSGAVMVPRVMVDVAMAKQAEEAKKEKEKTGDGK
tara:strand:- start:102051 stop:102470 length:420 start_codon:yes stop_codon:yes gene_type:complete